MNNRGAAGIKTLIWLVIITYATFAGYKLAMTYFTKKGIVEDARNHINKVKGPNMFTPEKAEDLLIKVLKDNGVYENDKINPVYAERSEDEKYIEYELNYRIRTDLLFFKTKYEKIKIVERSAVAARL